MERSEREKKLTKHVFSRFTEAKLRKEHHKSVWEEIDNYVFSRRGTWDVDTPPGRRDKSRKGRKIFDGTAQDACQLLADGIHGYLMSPSTTWFKFVFEDAEMNRRYQARRHLQETEELMYTLFQRSNFYETMSEIFLDGVTYGTAILFTEADPVRGRLNFQALHPGEVWFFQNRRSQVDTVFRRQWMSARDIIKEYGEDRLDEAFLKTAEDKPDEEHAVLHVVMPREDRDPKKADQVNMEYASLHFLEKGQRMLRESGFRRMPYIVWRWRTNTGEEYGRSPSWDALPDVLRANKIAKTQLRAAQLAVDPPVEHPSELTGRFQINPGGMIPYTDPSRRIFKMDVAGNYPIGGDILEIVREQIRNHYRIDFFLMLSQSVQHNRTATEVQEMQGEKAAILGTIIGKINSELLNPTIANAYEIAIEQGWIEPMPEEIMQDARGKVRISYLGPLAQAQQRYYQTQGPRAALNEILPLLQVWPEERDQINGGETITHILRAAGMPERLINDPRVVEAIKQQRAQQEAAAQQQAAMAQAAEVYGKTNQQPAEGSPAQSIADQLRGVV